MHKEKKSYYVKSLQNIVFDINAVSGIATQVHTFEKINPQIFVEKNNNLVLVYNANDK